MALPTLDAVFASAADQPRRYMLSQWLVNELGSGSVADYITLPERYLWAKIAVAAGAPRSEADYISLPKNYVWKAIYDAVSGSNLGTIDWSEKQALGYIAAAYRGDTGNPANLATYIDWPWRYQVASIITALATPTTYNAVIVSGAGSTQVNGTYTERGEYSGKPYYNLVGELDDIYFSSILWEEGTWYIYDFTGSNFYQSLENVSFPWLVEEWDWQEANGTPPAPTLTPTNV